jgi:hypothetical protein
MDILEKNKARFWIYETGMQSNGADKLYLIYEIGVLVYVKIILPGAREFICMDLTRKCVEMTKKDKIYLNQCFSNSVLWRKACGGGGGG